MDGKNLMNFNSLLAPQHYLLNSCLHQYQLAICWPCGDDWTVGQVDFERVWSNNGNKKSVMVAFQFKWHDVKDVPNNLLKHITLKNNDKN